MAKSLIRNTLGNRTFGFALPADGATAKTFCDNNLDGTYEVFEVEASSGNETEAEFYDVTVTGKNAAGRKTTFRFYASSTKNEDEIMTALQDKTFNGVKFEQIYIINMEKITVA
jgi:hypothetical protein